MSRLSDPVRRDLRPTQERKLDAYEIRKADGRARERWYLEWRQRISGALDVLADQDERMARRLAP